MTPILYILSKLFPAYAYIIGGYVSKKCLGLSQAFVAKALFYFLVPLVVFKGALFSSIGPFLFLVALSFGVSLLMVFAAGIFTNWFSSTLSKGALQCIFGYFNIGWFGIPIVQAIYGEQGAAIMTALYIGGMIFGNTVGFLLISSNESDKSVPIYKLLKVPSLYLAVVAFFAHAIGIREYLMNNQLLNMLLNAAASMTSVLGMGLVGMSIANISVKMIEWRKLGALLGMRLAVATIIVGALAATLSTLGYLQDMELQVFLLIPLLPIAANILVFASAVHNENEFIGLALLASTLLSCLLLIGWPGF